MNTSIRTRSRTRLTTALLLALTATGLGVSGRVGDEPAAATSARAGSSATQVADVFTEAAPWAGITINDDFTDRLTDVTHLLATHRPLVVGVQEGKQTAYAPQVRQDLRRRYGVRQDDRHDGAAGVAVLWNRTHARPIGADEDAPDRLGGGWLELLPAGEGLLARGVVWQDLELSTDAGAVRVRVASTHRPPQRDQHLWPAFDRALTTFVAASPLPVMVFMDANEDGGPAALERRTGLTWHGVGIDGVLTDLAAPAAPTALDRRHSDHHAVLIPLDVS
jgi:hypothetical protein